MKTTEQGTNSEKTQKQPANYTIKRGERFKNYKNIKPLTFEKLSLTTSVPDLTQKSKPNTNANGKTRQSV